MSKSSINFFIQSFVKNPVLMFFATFYFLIDILVIMFVKFDGTLATVTGIVLIPLYVFFIVGIVGLLASGFSLFTVWSLEMAGFEIKQGKTFTAFGVIFLFSLILTIYFLYFV